MNKGQITGEGILLDVQLSEDELRLRLDKNGITLRKEEEPTAATLTLSGCSAFAKAHEFLNRFIGESLYYECYPSEQPIGTTTAFIYEDPHDTIEVICEQATEVMSDYTTDELLYKCRRLSSLYIATSDEELKIRRKHAAFTTGLRAEINNELDRCRRKLAFFLAVNPQRAAEMQAQVDAYERVRTLMEHLQK